MISSAAGALGRWCGWSPESTNTATPTPTPTSSSPASLSSTTTITTTSTSGSSPTTTENKSTEEVEMSGGSSDVALWVNEKVQDLSVYSLKSYGAVPKHVAFIMDGNRRFAKKRNMGTKRGHSLGFDKLRETLDWCRKLGVYMVTVYAFSLENFNRNQEEVDYLMSLAQAKFELLMEENEIIQKHGVQIRVIGDIQNSKLPMALQKTIAKMVNMSKHNTNLVLNVAFAYTSQHEIAQAVKSVAHGVEQGVILESDIDARLIERSLLTDDAPPVDLLVRTSGEVRLSDFMLWQSGFSSVYFTSVLWPEFTFWDFVKCISHYQRSCVPIKQARVALNITVDGAAHDHETNDDNIDLNGNNSKTNEVVVLRNARVELFIKQLREGRLADISAVMT